MYGNTIDVSYKENTKNEVDSTIKIKLDEWYEKNIVEQNLSSYIADAGFCNDRSLINGDGASLNVNTNYGSYERIIQNHNPSNRCPNVERDLFTTSTSLIGNKALTYPIGLITADEASYAGYRYGQLNRMNYLHFASSAFWTLTPIAFQANIVNARNFYLTSEGRFDYGTMSVNIPIRPVINLSNEVEIAGGIGTSNDPFIIKMN